MSANANQLKIILNRSPKSDFDYIQLGLLGLSIFLQVSVNKSHYIKFINISPDHCHEFDDVSWIQW